MQESRPTAISSARSHPIGSVFLTLPTGSLFSRVSSRERMSSNRKTFMFMTMGPAVSEPARGNSSSRYIGPAPDGSGPPEGRTVQDRIVGNLDSIDSYYQ